MAVRRIQERRETAVVAAGGTTSGIVATQNAQSGNFQMPAAVDGVATVAIHVSNDGQTFAVLTDPKAAAATLPAAPYTHGANKVMTLPPETFAYPFFRFVLSAAQTPARTFIVNLK